MKFRSKSLTDEDVAHCRKHLDGFRRSLYHCTPETSEEIALVTELLILSSDSTDRMERLIQMQRGIEHEVPKYVLDALVSTGVLTPQQERSLELHLVKDAFRSNSPPNPGSFLDLLFTAFEKADSANHEMLKPVIIRMILKYGLKCNCPEESESRV